MERSRRPDWCSKCEQGAQGRLLRCPNCEEKDFALTTILVVSPFQIEPRFSKTLIKPSKRTIPEGEMLHESTFKKLRGITMNTPNNKPVKNTEVKKLLVISAAALAVGGWMFYSTGKLMFSSAPTSARLSSAQQAQSPQPVTAEAIKLK